MKKVSSNSYRHWFILAFISMILSESECLKLLTATPPINQCPPELIFDEEKQQCSQPITKEDFQCLLAAKISQSNLKVEPITTNLPVTITRTTKVSRTKSFRPLTTKPDKLTNDNKKSEKPIKTSYSVTNNIKSNFAKENKNEPIEIINKKTILKKIQASKSKLNSKLDESEDLNAKDEIKDVQVVSNEDDNKYKRICTVTNWSQFRAGRAQFQLEYTNTHLCNYVLFSSVAVSEDSSMLGDEYKLQPIQHNDFDLYAKLNGLKKRKPTLKTILRITDDNGRLYSRLAKKKETRANFIENLLEYIDIHSFDGVDIDWQYPNGVSGGPHDKQNFILLLKELRVALDFKQILSITISPLTDKIQNSYLLFDLNSIVDIVVVEAFDYYGPWDKRTGIIAPLSKMDHQYSTEAFLNIDGTVTFLKALGLGADKIVIGLAAYARAYMLQDSNQNQLNAVSTGNGFSGTYTKINGLLSYYEVCEKKKRGTWKTEWVAHAEAPFMYNEDGEWISFENKDSLAKKMNYVRDNNLAGVLVNSIDMDDFHGSFCNEGPYPFLRGTLGLLLGEPIQTPKPTTSIIETKTKKTTTAKPKGERKKSAQQTKEINFKTTTNPPNLILVTPPSKKENKDMIEARKEHVKSPSKPEISHDIIKNQLNLIKKQQQINFNEQKPSPQNKQLPQFQKPQQVSPQHHQDAELKIQQQQAEQQILQQKAEQQAEQQILQKQAQQQVQQQIQQQQAQQQIQQQQAQQQIQQQQAQQQIQQQQAQQQVQQDFNLNQHVKQQEVIQKMQQGQQIIENPQTQMNYQQEQWIKQLQQHQQQVQNHLRLQQEWQNQQQQVNQVNQVYYQPPPNPQIYQPAPAPPPPAPAPVQYPQQHSNQIAPSDSSKCTNKQSGIYRDEMDCKSFYICETLDTPNTYRYHTFTCPQGLIFSMDECTCNWPGDQNQCIVPLTNSFCKTTGPPAESAYNEPKQQEVAYVPNSYPSYSSFSCYGKEKGLHRDPQDCTKFFYCQIIHSNANSNEDLVVIKHDFTCPAGLHFNSLRCQCDWPSDNVCEAGGTNTLCLPGF